MKKRVMALMCALLFLLCLLPGSVSAADELYFLAINDSLPELSAQVMPIRVAGVTYVPCTIFDSRVTGVNCGIYYGQDRSKGTVTLYNKDKILEFNIAAGTAYAYTEGETYSYQAVMYNGLPYVPAASVCRYFRLTCSFLYTDYGSLLRIKNGSEVLSDTMFLSSAAPILASRMNQYQTAQSEGQSTPSGNGGQSSSQGGGQSGQTTQIPQKPEAGVGEGIQLSLAFQVVDGEDLTGILNTLSQYRVKAIFFFRTKDLKTYDNAIRQIDSEGNRVGLIPQGSTAQKQLNDLQEGNLLLEHILRQDASFVLSRGDKTVQGELKQAGYLLWTGGIQAAGESGSLYRTVIQKIAAVDNFTRILLDDGIPNSTLSRILNQLKISQYEFRMPKETSY